MSAVKNPLCKSAKASSEHQIQAPNHLTPHFHFLIGPLTSCREIRKVTIIKISASLNAGARARTQKCAASLFSFAPASISEAALGQVNAIICHANRRHEARVPIGCDVFISGHGSSHALPLLPPAAWTRAKQPCPAACFKPARRQCERQLRQWLRRREINSLNRATAAVTWHALFRTDNRHARCSCLILSHFFFFFLHCCCFLNSRRISRFDGKKPERSDYVWSKRFSRRERAVLSLAPARWGAFMQIATPCNFNASAEIEFVFFPLARRPWVRGAIGPLGRGLRGYRRPL